MAVETRGGVTLSKMYERAMKLLLRARDGLERLETLEHSTTAIDSPDLSLLIKNDIFQIQSHCAEMDHLCRSVTSTSQRDFPHLWKRKVEQVVEGAAFLNEGLDNYNLRNEKRIMEAREREELLGRANEESSDHILRILDEEAQAMQSVRSSSRMLEEACATGEAILFKYSDQREILKRAQ